MSDWTNHVTIAAPRNGTTSHICDPSNVTGGGTVAAGTAFTPTAGRFLLVVGYGSVTFTTPSGWTLPTNGSAVNNGGCYVFYKASAAGADTFTTTQNGSNFPVCFDIYEFNAGSTFGTCASGTSIGNTPSGNTPTLSSLTGTHWIGSCAGFNLAASTAATSASWTSGSQVSFNTAASSPTDGYDYSLTEFNADTSASRSSTVSWVNIPPTSGEGLTFSVSAAAGAALPGLPWLRF